MIFEDLLLLFLLGSLAGFINVMAGGGSTLTLPFLLFLGLDAATANGTNRIAILALTLSAVLSFRRENFSDFKLSSKLGLLTLPGAILGAIYAQTIETELFKKILGVSMLGVVILIMLPKKYKQNFTQFMKGRSVLIYIIFILMGLYGGFIQIGIGFLLMLALDSLLDISLIKVNMHKVFIVLIYTIPVLTVFVWNGNFDLTYGLILAAGMAAGAWWAAKLAVKKGDKIIRKLLVISIILISLKLIGIY